MKKSKLAVLAGIIGLGLLTTACGQGQAKEVGQEEGLRIGINQYMEHPALDDARQGFIDGLEEMGLEAKIDYKNSQGDLTNAMSISEKFTTDRVDLIYSIGTPAAQATKQVTSEIPVLFSAVTDPVSSGLVDSLEKPGGNITGTSDKANIEEQLRLFKELDPSIEKIGVIYNTGESNSEVQIKEVEALVGNLGLQLEVVGVNSINDVSQSLDSLTKKVDAMYILSDNMIASSVGLVSKKLLDKGMISISAEESQVRGGLLLTNGLSYYDLGRQTAEMAREILLEGREAKDLPVAYSKNKQLKINRKTLDSLGLDSPILKDAKEIE